MRVSLNQIKQFIDFELPAVDELVHKINQQLGGVEEVIDLAERYKDAAIAKVVKCEKHPNADKLSVCEIDAGTGENIQVVCGAPNVREGLFVVWLPPKSIVPATFEDDEPFVLEPKELRGVMSHGMLAAADELGIGSDHSGIVEINPDEWKPNDIEIKPGTKFAEAYGLNDTIIDIENKMFTHRPDLFGQLGVAREIAGIQHKTFDDPDWYWKLPQFTEESGLELEVSNDTPENVPRFMAVALKDVEVRPSPLWLQCSLVAMGSKPINNIVDVTNYIMLLTAQPTHAYDYDKLRGHKLGVRLAKKGENAELLNGKTYELDESDIVIVDGEGVVGLGGIMGGGNSEVSSETRNIVLEVANFDMYAVRRSSMRHGLFTDALTRFNKGQSPLQNDRVLNLLMMSVKDVAGGEQASSVVDMLQPGDIYDMQTLSGEMTVTAGFINERLGLDLSADNICQLLKGVHFACYEEDGMLHVTAPFWRTDIELAEDIVEEVGRLYGFGKLPRELPSRSIKPVAMNQSRLLKQSVRERLATTGANEVLTYSFVHENTIQKTGQDPSRAFRISNALSPDLQYYRLSILSSLLDKVHMNSKAGYDRFALFEIGKVHYKGKMDEDEPDVPHEDEHVALIVAHDDKQRPAGAPYYLAKRLLSHITDSGVALQPLAGFDFSEDERGRQLTSAYEPGRSAVIVRDGQVHGVVGEFTAAVRKAFKLPAFCAGFEVHTDMLAAATHSYEPLSRFPQSERDICFQVAADVPYESVTDALRSVPADASVKYEFTPVDIYQASGENTKNVTIRVTFTPYNKTLGGSEVDQLMSELGEGVVQRLGAAII